MVSAPAEPADSFADQVLPYARQLHSAALRLTGNPTDADDLGRKRLRALLRDQMDAYTARAA